MLDIGFSEIVVIFVLALVVLGPEKLPRVASQVGRWIGRARGMARQFREQLEEEVHLEETRRAQQPPPAAAPPATSAPGVISPPDVAPHPEVLSSSEVISPSDVISAPEVVPAPDVTLSAITPAVTPPAAASPEPSPGVSQTSDVHTSTASSSRQQDWVGDVSEVHQPSQVAQDAAATPSHERGT